MSEFDRLDITVNRIAAENVVCSIDDENRYKIAGIDYSGNKWYNGSKNERIYHWLTSAIANTVRFLVKIGLLKLVAVRVSCKRYHMEQVTVKMSELADLIGEDIYRLYDRGLEVECIVMGQDVFSKVSLGMSYAGSRTSRHLSDQGWYFTLPELFLAEAHRDICGNVTVKHLSFRGIRIKVVPWFEGILIVPADRM